MISSYLTPVKNEIILIFLFDKIFDPVFIRKLLIVIFDFFS